MAREMASAELGRWGRVRAPQLAHFGSLLISPPVLLLAAVARLALGPVSGETPSTSIAFWIYPAAEVSFLASQWVLAVILAVLVHELGHLVMARVVRFRMVSFAAGPILIDRDERNTTIRLNWGWHVGGHIAAMPMSDSRVRRRTLLVLAAGPAASLLFGLLALLAAVKVTPSVYPDALSLGASSYYSDPQTSTVYATYEGDWDSALADGLGYLGLVSLFVCATALVPLRGPVGQISDGLRIKMLLHRTADAQAWLALTRLHGALLRGERPREWDVDLLTRAMARVNPSWPGDPNGFYLSYLAALDVGHIERAGSYLDYLMAVDAFQTWRNGSGVYIEAAYFEACYRHNPQAARAYLALVNSDLRKRLAVGALRAEAAICLAEGDAVGAHAAIDTALAENQQSKHQNTALDQVGLEWLQALDRALQPAH